MSAGTLTVHKLFDVLTDLDALWRLGSDDISTLYVDDIADPAVRIVFANDPEAPDLASSFTITNADGATLYAAGDYGVSLAAFDAALAATGVAGALDVLFDELAVVALSADAKIGVATIKPGLRLEGNDEGTIFTVTEPDATVNAGGGDDSILLTMRYGEGSFYGGDGYDTLRFVEAPMAVDISIGSGTISMVQLLTGEAFTGTFESIEFFRGSAGAERFSGVGSGLRFEGGAGDDQFMLDDGATLLADIVDFSGEGGPKGVAVNLGPDDLADAGPDLLAALEAILEGDAAPWFHGVRDTFGSYDNIMPGFIVEGTARADFFYGSEGADAFLGNAGDDHFFGGDGDDRIDGGDGDDTFYLKGGRDDYDITFDGELFIIVARDGSGTDAVSGVERFLFANAAFTAAQLLPIGGGSPLAADDDNGGDAIIEAAAGVSSDDRAQGNVLSNDSDAGGEPIAVVGVHAGTTGEFEPVSGSQTIAGRYGTLTIAADGAWSYALDDGRPDTDALRSGMTAQEVFTYRISAGGEQSEARLTLSILGSNDAPRAGNDAGLALQTAEDVPLTIDAAALLANYADAEGDTLMIASVSDGVGGTVVLNGNGTIGFTPSADFNGQAYFSYSVTDGAGAQSDPATATIAVTPVNDAPVFPLSGAGAATAFSVKENTTAVSKLGALDVDSSTLTYSLGGLDKGAFVLVGNALRFATAPDFEAPRDRGHDNVYNVTVTVSDGALTDSRALSIRVLDAPGNKVSGTAKADGIDIAHGSNGKSATNEGDFIDGKAGNDTISGGAGNDTLVGGSGDDRLKGDAGDDVLRGGTGKDRLDGGSGRDTADYSDASKPIVVELDGARDARVRVGGAAEDWVRNIENVGGGKGADKLTGDAAGNVLAGNGGNDLLAGGLGADTLRGGAGRDRFVFDSKLKASNVDTIVDFAHNLDRIVLDHAVFRALGSTLDAGEFYARAGATAAHDKSDRIIYDKATGDLYYDSDGKGGHAAIHFATLSSRPVLDAGDFAIV